MNERLHPVVSPQTVPLAAANGRILAADLIAAIDVPPHDNSAVDGYAVYFDDLDPQAPTRLPVVGRAAAGHPLGQLHQRGQAVRIFTGAPMPNGPDSSGGPGPDTVMMQEDCVADDEGVTLQPGIRRGANRRSRAEDVSAGTTVLRTGQRLRPQDLGIAASIGRAELSVFSRLSVACFSTGDEVCDPGTTPPPGGIYDANRYCLMALLERLGCAVTDLGILPDNLAAITAALDAAATKHHVIVTSGGMSVGEEDYVATAVTDLGSLHFWRLAIKPGRPVAMGQIGRTPIIGLPGNPAAMMVTFLRVAPPAVLRLAGAAPSPLRPLLIPAAFSHSKKTGRREFVRVSLVPRPDGVLMAQKFPREGAGVLSSLVDSDGLVELPEDLTQVTPGMMVDFLSFAELLA
ncbi:MAG: molybdopterin molybdotransferase MoeA [Alphaproteobacteria bacterium]